MIGLIRKTIRMTPANPIARPSNPLIRIGSSGRKIGAITITRSGTVELRIAARSTVPDGGVCSFSSMRECCNESGAKSPRSAVRVILGGLPNSTSSGMSIGCTSCGRRRSAKAGCSRPAEIPGAGSGSLRRMAALPADCAIMVAAVADWRVEASPTKLKKGDGPPKLKFVPTRDILAEVASHEQRPTLVVGFAAETDRVVENAIAKRVAMGQGAIEHVADDLHVPVRMGAETVSALHPVFVDDPQRAPVHVAGVVIIGEAEGMIGL